MAALASAAGRPPDAHRDIGIGQGENGVARRDDGKRRPGHRPADYHHDDSQGHRHQHGAGEGGPHLIGVTRPQGLGGEPRGSHAQEAETEIEDVEDQGADGDGADVVGARQVADDGGIDQAEERYRNIG